MLDKTYILPDLLKNVTVEMGIMFKQMMQSMFGIWAKNLHFFDAKSNIIV